MNTIQVTDQFNTVSLKISPAITTIVYWANEEDTESHCLARLYPDGEKLVVMLSEIRSNVVDDPKHPGIDSGFVAVVNVLYEQYPEKFNVLPENILWVSHFGSFSHYDSLRQGYNGPDSFYCESLRLHEGKFEDFGDIKLLEWWDMEPILGHIEIENIYDVLRSIGWTKHNVDCY
jgi:hypothetical protein